MAMILTNLLRFHCYIPTAIILHFLASKNYIPLIHANTRMVAIFLTKKWLIFPIIILLSVVMHGLESQKVRMHTKLLFFLPKWNSYGLLFIACAQGGEDKRYHSCDGDAIARASADCAHHRVS